MNRDCGRQVRVLAGASRALGACLLAFCAAAPSGATLPAAGGAPPQADRVRLTADPAEDRAPAWSPDGETLLFQSDRSGNADLWLMRADGSDPRALTTHPSDDTMPAWAPGGDRIVFQSDRDGVAGLYVLDRADGSVRLLIEDHSPELMPDWSPDGRWIAFASTRSGNLDIWVISADGRSVEQLTSHRFRDGGPRWSPDGDSVLFFSRRDTGGEWDELYVLERSNGDIRRLTSNPRQHDFTADWAPGGERVVTAISDQVADRALAIYAADGVRGARFADGFARVFQPAWSPDGTRIAYAAREVEGAAADIYVERVETREP